MHVEQPPEQLIDQSDGHPIERIRPSGSRYDIIAVKATDTEIVVKAHEGASDSTNSWRFPLQEKLLQAAGIDDQRRRDIDDDIQDAVQLVGYTLSDIDAYVKGF